MSPVKLNVATDQLVWSWIAERREGQSSCVLSGPSSEPSSGKVSSPSPPLPALKHYSCLFCSFGTYCLVTSCTAPLRRSVM